MRIYQRMNASTHIPHPHKLPARLATLATLAALLERLEHAPGQVGAQQYRQVAQQITILLQQAEPDRFLDMLLSAAPATSELYENLRYAQAGLCRTPLESALNAEMAASKAIERARLR